MDTVENQPTELEQLAGQLFDRDARARKLHEGAFDVDARAGAILAAGYLALEHETYIGSEIYDAAMAERGITTHMAACSPKERRTLFRHALCRTSIVTKKIDSRVDALRALVEN